MPGPRTTPTVLILRVDDPWLSTRLLRQAPGLYRMIAVVLLDALICILWITLKFISLSRIHIACSIVRYLLSALWWLWLALSLPAVALFWVLLKELVMFLTILVTDKIMRDSSPVLLRSVQFDISPRLKTWKTFKSPFLRQVHVTFALCRQKALICTLLKVSTFLNPPCDSLLVRTLHHLRTVLKQADVINVSVHFQFVSLVRNSCFKQLFDLFNYFVWCSFLWRLSVPPVN